MKQTVKPWAIQRNHPRGKPTLDLTTVRSTREAAEIADIAGNQMLWSPKARLAANRAGLFRAVRVEVSWEDGR